MQFKRYLEACKWDKSRYATYLGNLLQGKAPEDYVRMPLEDILDNDKLKNALLRRFEMTEERFRRKLQLQNGKKGKLHSRI